VRFVILCHLDHELAQAYGLLLKNCAPGPRILAKCPEHAERCHAKLRKLIECGTGLAVQTPPLCRQPDRVDASENRPHLGENASDPWKTPVDFDVTQMPRVFKRCKAARRRSRAQPPLRSTRQQGAPVIRTSDIAFSKLFRAS
jgi:hypothetical protein